MALKRLFNLFRKSYREELTELGEKKIPSHAEIDAVLKASHKLLRLQRDATPFLKKEVQLVQGIYNKVSSADRRIRILQTRKLLNKVEYLRSHTIDKVNYFKKMLYSARLIRLDEEKIMADWKQKMQKARKARGKRAVAPLNEARLDMERINQSKKEQQNLKKAIRILLNNTISMRDIIKDRYMKFYIEDISVAQPELAKAIQKDITDLDKVLKREERRLKEISKGVQQIEKKEKRAIRIVRRLAA